MAAEVQLSGALHPVRCLSTAASRSSRPSRRTATALTIGGRQSPGARSASRIAPRKVAHDLVGAVTSALLTTKTSPTSRMPALAAWIPSPMPGASRTGGVGQSATSDLGLTDPDGLHEHHIAPGGVEDAQRLRRGPGGRRGARGWPSSGCRRPDRARAPASARGRPAAHRREGRGRIDGQDADPPSLGPERRHQRRGHVDLPTPGEPVRPHHGGRRRAAPAQPSPRAAPARRPPRARSAGRPRAADPAGPGRPGRRADPYSRRTGQARRDADDQRVALAAAAAQRRGADAPPRRRSSSASVRTSRAPDMPIGWPSAIAPPLTLTRSSSSRARASTGCPPTRTPR